MQKNLKKCMGKIPGPLKSNHPPETIAVCMIVKNEESKIADAINSVIPFADEIIINDTGSTDGTIEIIKEYQKIINNPPIILIQNPWEKSFSKARNQGLAKSRCQWNFWLDADDKIEPGEANKINTLKRAPLDRVFGFTIQNTNQYGMPKAEFVQVRMFPNHPLLGFRRRIHEQILPAIAELGLHLVYTDGKIIHTGYENEQYKKKKQHRNLELMGMEPDANTDYMLLMAQGDSNYILGEWEKGIDFFKKAYQIKNLDKINLDAYLVIPSRIGAGFHGLGQFKKAAEWYEIGYQRWPQNIENCFTLGKCYEKLNEPEKALEYFNKVFELPKMITSQNLRYDQCRLYSFHNATRLLMNMGRNRECLEILELMRNAYPDWELESDDIIPTNQGTIVHDTI